jgi:preprotein translocase subunit SecD
MVRIVPAFLLLMATPALAADPVLSFVFKSEKLELGAEGLADASPSFDAQGAQPVVLFRLSQTGASGFAEITARHVGEQMDIIVCGKVIASPIIREAIQGGSGQLSGAFTVEETTALALKLKSGRCDAAGKDTGGAGGKGASGAGAGKDAPGS